MLCGQVSFRHVAHIMHPASKAFCFDCWWQLGLPVKLLYPFISIRECMSGTKPKSLTCAPDCWRKGSYAVVAIDVAINNDLEYFARHSSLTHTTQSEAPTSQKPHLLHRRSASGPCSALPLHMHPLSATMQLPLQASASRATIPHSNIPEMTGNQARCICADC